MRLPWQSDRAFPGYWRCHGINYMAESLIPLEVDLFDCKDQCTCKLYRRKLFEAIIAGRFKRAGKLFKFGMIRMLGLAPAKI